MKPSYRSLVKNYLIIKLLSIALFLLLLPTYAETKEVTQDTPNSHDNPLISRYEGSFIIGYSHQQYSDLTLPLSIPKIWDATVEKSIEAEGEHTRIIYVAPKGRSTLEVFRNYQNELQKDNTEVLFSCEKSECGKKDGLVMVRKLLYPPERKLKNMGQVTEYAFSSPEDMRYLVAKISGPKEAYLSLFVAKETFTNFSETAARPIILLDIIEMEAMEQKMVVVPADEMAQKIQEHGSFSLYGIYFDTDSSTIKSESNGTLLEIEKLLVENPAMRLYIVGHTDNVGGFEHNMTLSQQRGKAVLEKLLQNNTIDPKRLQSHGVGELAPKASNDTEEGRKLNRRVELVKQ